MINTKNTKNTKNNKGNSTIKKERDMNKIKLTNVRLPMYLWLFVKQKSSEHETSVNNIVKTLLEKYKNKCEKSETTIDFE